MTVYGLAAFSPPLNKPITRSPKYLYFTTFDHLAATHMHYFLHTSGQMIERIYVSHFDRIQRFETETFREAKTIHMSRLTIIV